MGVFSIEFPAGYFAKGSLFLFKDCGELIVVKEVSCRKYLYEDFDTFYLEVLKYVKLNCSLHSICRKRRAEPCASEASGSKCVKSDTSVSSIRLLSRRQNTSSDFFSQLIFKTLLFIQKNELRQMYGKNMPSPKKHCVAQGLKIGKNFHKLAEELNIAQATVEVYGIDCLAAGQEVDHQTIAKCLDISEESFERIKSEIMSSDDKRLRNVRDNLREEFSYNQIRFVLACQIHDLEL